MGALQQALLMAKVAGGGNIPTSGLQYRFIGDDLLGVDGIAQALWPAGDGTTTTCSQAVVLRQPIKKTNIINGHAVARGAGNKDMAFDTIPALTNTLSFFAVFTYAGNGSFMGGGGENTCPQVRIQSNKIELLAATTAVIGTSATTLSTGTPYTIGVLFDNSLGSDRVKFYLNGVADGTGNNATAMTGRTGTLMASVGPGEQFNGDIAEMFNYDRVVTAGELTTIFDALRATYATW